MEIAFISPISLDKINLGNINDLQMEKYYLWVMLGKAQAKWFKHGGIPGINTMERQVEDQSLVVLNTHFMYRNHHVIYFLMIYDMIVDFKQVLSFHLLAKQ